VQGSTTQAGLPGAVALLKAILCCREGARERNPVKCGACSLHLRPLAARPLRAALPPPTTKGNQQHSGRTLCGRASGFALALVPSAARAAASHTKGRK